MTPLECERLQTLPDNYTEGLSNTQRYKTIGNGWTVEVIHHIFSYLKIAIDEGIEPLKLKDRTRPKQSYRILEDKEEGVEMSKTASNEEVEKMKQELKEKDRIIESLQKEIQEIKVKMFDYLFKEKTA